ncbi:MAG: hypothetical protein QOH84_247 [Kribbellaceae bacterium]|jgi:hypothetical protein|nr:hypothetical protein [Kribbellaceae bacterium]
MLSDRDSLPTVTQPDWSDVPDRLKRLTRAPFASAVLGSELHHWKLESPLSLGELAELEAQLQVELPEGYRSFLLQAGRGGAGPAYGLFPVRRIAGRWQWEGDGAELSDLGTLSRPFPHVTAFNPANSLPEPPTPGDYTSPEAYEAAESEYWEHHDAVAFSPEHSIGLLYLSHLGCALRHALVITGPARGQMWSDETADGNGYSPLHDLDGAPLDFTHWYRHWLDTVAPRLTTPAR